MKSSKFLIFFVMVTLLIFPNYELLSKSTKKVRLKQKKLIQESLLKLKTYLIGYNQISVDFPIVRAITTKSISTQHNQFNHPFLADKLLQNILLWLGTPYRLGGSSHNGIDCSNFVSKIINETFNIHFPANAETQSRLVIPILNIEELSYGDLIFFSGRNKKSKRIGHVGIYLGNGIFAHSSTSKGVIISHITDGYYTQRFRFGGRLPLFEKDFVLH